MTGRVANKVALITGGASGLGRATAMLMAKEGAKVVVADRNLEGARKVAEEIGKAAIAVDLDVTSEQQWIAALDVTEAAFGKLNVMVHSAGVGVLKSVEDISVEEWRFVHSVNLDGPFLGIKHGLPRMRKHAPGSIVIISSVSGIIAGHNMSAYNTSKAGARMLAKTTALHCAKRGYDIRCNSVHPTFIDTPMVQSMIYAGGDPAERKRKLEAQVPLGKLGEPDDVAYCILHLASDESKFTTGAEFVIDGGITAQ
ncbi:MAG TPA: SDR family oxidoreductase [Ferrovibrio sp.]|jgi:3(or 17)beta-hydroxysteroid dehydrogenase|uniref:SDR family oxidoreductase n=1 Tax=Ferrovibrio sp. TaxID=1917215 RepID=UPI002B4AE2FF|nr:SDR family oxidoreductase [Ferrovibrio sp.]HLT76640.1 SDR family oxidoreductase [Ferrovibrio sp.]